MPVGLITHSDCLLHDMGDEHIESPARIKSIQELLDSSGLGYSVKHIEAIKATKDQLRLAHDERYIESIFDASPESGIVILDPDTSLNPHSLNAALYAAGAGIQAVDQIMSDELSSAFCLTRPPGHHAEYDRAMGFCIFNNISIAACYAKQKYKLERIAIVDFDVHHGNGTENIVKNQEGITFFSLFQHPYYPFSGAESSASNIINSPMDAGSGSQPFRDIISNVWVTKLNELKPQLILVSAGFDAHAQDGISEIKLKDEDYRWVTEELSYIAKKYAKGRIISTLEGGYHLDSLARSVVAHINVLIVNQA